MDSRWKWISISNTRTHSKRCGDDVRYGQISWTCIALHNIMHTEQLFHTFHPYIDFYGVIFNVLCFESLSLTHSHTFIRTSARSLSNIAYFRITAGVIESIVERKRNHVPIYIYCAFRKCKEDVWQCGVLMMNIHMERLIWACATVHWA